MIKITAPALVFFWFRSLQITKLPERPPSDTVLIFWHKHIFAVIAYLSNFSREQSITALVSASEDGKLLQTLLSAFHFKIIEGSSSEGGYRSLLSLQEELVSGTTVLITPDGPKGPVGKLKSGVIQLARYSGKPIVCVHAQYQTWWELKSWDRAIIPKPFTRCELIFSDPFFINRNASEFEQSELRNKLEASLDGDQTCRRMEESLL